MGEIGKEHLPNAST